MSRTPILLIVACLLLAAGCGGNSVLAGPTSTTAEPAPTTSVESTSTTPPTTTVSTTTTTLSLPTTTAGGGGFHTEAGSPPDALDSFAGGLDANMEMMGISMVMTVDFTYVGSAYECVATVNAAGTSMEMAVVATPETIWLDQGYGFEESGPFDSNVQTVVGICPASPTFWMGFGEVPWAAMTGEPDTVNGIPAQRVDFTAMAGAMDLGALAALMGGGVGSGMDIDEAVFWIADPGGWPVAMQVGMVMLDLEGMGDVPISMHYEINTVNDPSLSVQVPPT